MRIPTEEERKAGMKKIDLLPYAEGKKFDLERITFEVRFLAVVNTQAVIELGKRFIWVKEELKQGEFLKWLEEVGFARRTASRYMMIADRLANSKWATVAHLPLSKVYALLGLPDEDLEEFESRGSILGKSRDEIEQMSATELREKVRRQREQIKKGQEQLRVKSERLSDILNRPPDKLPYVGTEEEKEAHLKLRDIQCRAICDLGVLRQANLEFSRQLQGEILGLVDWLHKQIAELQYDLHKRYSYTDYPPGVEKEFVERIPPGRNLFQEDMDRFDDEERKKGE